MIASVTIAAIVTTTVVPILTKYVQQPLVLFMDVIKKACCVHVRAIASRVRNVVTIIFQTVTGHPHLRRHHRQSTHLDQKAPQNSSTSLQVKTEHP